MRIAFIASAALVAGILSANPARAGLLGDTVDGAYYYPDLATVYQQDGDSTVSPSALFNFATGAPNTTAVVTDTTITVTFDQPGGFAPAGFNGVVITDLTSSDITGVTIDAASDLIGFGSGDLSFTSNSILIDLASLDIPTGSEQIVVDVATSTAAPEPISMSLLATGLIGLGMVRRRKAA